MSDALNSRSGSDRQRINIHQDWEVNYWTRKLGLSVEELKQVVQQVGDRVHDVVDHVSHQQAPGAGVPKGEARASTRSH